MKLGGIRPNTIKENAAAKARAQQDAEKLRGVLEPMVTAGKPLRAIAEALAGAGKTTKTGQPLSPTQVGPPKKVGVTAANAESGSQALC